MKITQVVKYAQDVLPRYPLESSFTLQDLAISLKSTMWLNHIQVKTSVLRFNDCLYSYFSNYGNQIEDISSLIKLEDLRFLCDDKLKDNDAKTWSFRVVK